MAGGGVTHRSVGCREPRVGDHLPGEVRQPDLGWLSQQVAREAFDGHVSSPRK